MKFRLDLKGFGKCSVCRVESDLGDLCADFRGPSLTRPVPGSKKGACKTFRRKLEGPSRA